MQLPRNKANELLKCYWILTPKNQSAASVHPGCVPPPLPGFPSEWQSGRWRNSAVCTPKMAIPQSQLLPSWSPPCVSSRLISPSPSPSLPNLRLPQSARTSHRWFKLNPAKGQPALSPWHCPCSDLYCLEAGTVLHTRQKRDRVPLSTINKPVTCFYSFYLIFWTQAIIPSLLSRPSLWPIHLCGCHKSFVYLPPPAC